MSYHAYHAYLDAIEAKTGKFPRGLIDLAHARGLGPTRTATREGEH